MKKSFGQQVSSYGKRLYSFQTIHFLYSRNLCITCRYKNMYVVMLTK